MGILHEPQPQSTPGVNGPTQFALTSIDRIVFLLTRYEALRVDATILPPAPHRPPLAYVEATLSELRRELVAREGAEVAA